MVQRSDVLSDARDVPVIGDSAFSPERSAAVACLDAASNCSESHAGAMLQLAREYAELPGLSLTMPQVQRLLHVDAPSAHEIVATFDRCGCLVVARDGRIRRPAGMTELAWRSLIFQVCRAGDHWLADRSTAAPEGTTHARTTHCIVK